MSREEYRERAVEAIQRLDRETGAPVRGRSGILEDLDAAEPHLQRMFLEPIHAEVDRMMREAGDPQLNEFAQQQAQFDAQSLEAALDKEGENGG